MTIRVIAAVLLMSSLAMAGQVKLNKETKAPTKVDILQTEQLKAAPPTEPADSRDAGVHWQVVSGGGGMTTVGSYTLGSTIGQTAAGFSTIGTNTLHSGFWQNWTEAEGCCSIRGDVNHSGETIPDISDLVYLVSYMFLGGDLPICPLEADVDGDNEIINISDLVYLVDYMFMGGPPPVPCP